MTPNDLSNWLTTNDPAPLAPEDRATLAQALAELAVSQALIAKQTLLLDSYNADHADIESTVRRSLAALTMSDESDTPTVAFDFEKAKQARSDLASKLSAATSLRSMIALAINMVRAVAQ